ncbi:M15 family metallopeptidase [Marvinbryantia formatexigens DSM 14469]|nr:M15 family metallopeptidase [Marvinbryantia formatexigens]UWO24874.1 M15 family metallopeptidase [Marvinbryantia formatexigens DSM 14469]SDG77890.1 Fibronectin type III domain-containing protein [Marvinbryantia formatexigens]
MVCSRKNSIVRVMMTMLAALMLWAGLAAFAQAAKKPAAPAQVKSVKVTASGTTKHKVTWKKVSGATGYQIFCRDYSSGSTLYKRVKTISGASKTSCTISGRKQGKAYAYVVRAYKKNKAGTSFGKLSGIAYGYIAKKTSQTDKNGSTGNNSSAGTGGSSGGSAGTLQNPTKKQKYQKVFGDASLSMRYPGGYYTSASQAKKNMKSITVKTWDFKNGKSGEKYTRTWTIMVHKNLAATVQQIFNEIYKDPSKFPIHELGGYEWRGGHSEHNTGTAIDINWTENYMVNVRTGAITAGKYWKPGTDPYSIPKDGVVAKIFKKYGFSQGDWGDSKDYMHFSYFGT